MENSIVDVVNLIHDKKRADALDKINDLLNNKAAEALDTYKKVVADTYFNEPVDQIEDQ
jgi:type I restriction-modification system DNA methylase subunit